MVERRQLLMAGAVGGAALLITEGSLRAWGRTPVAAPLKPADEPPPKTPALKKYVDPLPRLLTAVPDRTVYPGTEYYEITMLQRQWRFHRDLGMATTWGYWATNPSDRTQPIGTGYLGPTITVTRDRPVVVKYRTELPTTHLFQRVIDAMREAAQTQPDMHMEALPPDVNVPNVVHLHGGFTPPQSDGLPTQWFTSDGIHGPTYATLGRVEPNEAIYGYPNDHQTCMLWYHDHALMATSLNVYAGLAGAYLIREPSDERLGLPQGEYEVPLILQDKTFKPDGSLLYTLHTLHFADGFDTPVVNGKAYPFLAVEPRRYRFRILDASNSRFWRLQFAAGKERLPFWLIGTDDGFRAPVRLDSILISPSERIDVIVDFSQVPPGTKVTLLNFGSPVHFPGGISPDIPEIMQFRVTEPLSGPDETTPPDELVLPPVVPLQPTPGIPRREFVMYQGPDPIPLLLINALPFEAPNEDFIKAGTTEIWEYINVTGGIHPMHVHLVDFQVLNRQKLNVPGYLAAYEKWLAGGRRPAAKPVLADYLVGPPIPPDPDEALALKDTVKVYTGMVTRIIQTFNVPGGIPSIPGSGTTLPAQYLHHCHILEHEDHDKMRPWAIVANPAGGVDAGDGGSAGVNPTLAVAGATMLATAAVGGAVLARRYLADEAPPSPDAGTR